MKKLVANIFKSLEKEVGVEIVLEPEFGCAGLIILPDGQRRYFRNSYLDLNPLGASEIASDKDYAAFFMKKFGYPTVPSFKFYSHKLCKIIKSRQDIDAAYKKAKNMGFPVILKPNDGSQGHGVTKVYTKEEFYKSARKIFSKHNVMLVQRVMTGHDYRLVVLNNNVISVYERLPLSITGDGRSSIRKLLELKQKEFIKTNRDTKIDIDDFRIKLKLKRQKLTIDSILNNNQRIFLLDNGNLSSGGDAFDVTDKISPEFKKIAIKLSKDMNLRFSGVDIMSEDPINSINPKKYVILEINAAPGLDHYAYLGNKQKKIVRELYKKVFEEMIKG